MIGFSEFYDDTRALATAIVDDLCQVLKIDDHHKEYLPAIDRVERTIGELKDDD